MIKLHVVKEAIKSSSSLPFITNFNLFVNAKTVTDFSAYFKDVKKNQLRESSFNMTRGGMKILRGGSENF